MIDKAQLLAEFKAARKQGLQPMVVRMGKGDDTTIAAFADTGETYTAWARTEDNGDPLVVYFTPGKVPYSFLAYNAEMEVERNDRNQLEIKRPYTGLRDSLGGAVLPTNGYDFIHTHGSDVEAGQLDASEVFDSGQVLLEYGGTEADLSATGAGHLIQATAGANVSVVKDNFTATAAPTTGDDSGDGYAVGSLWLDTTNDNIYMAIDVSVGAAVWEQLNGGGSSPWTTTSNVIHPSVLTDAVAIGASSNATAKLYILEDDPNEIPLRVKAAAGQAISVLYIEDDSGNILFNISESGQVSVNLSETAGGAFIANGTSGTTLLFADAGTNVLHIGGAFVFNELGNDTDARFEGDNDANLLFLNAGTDRVGVGDDTPDGRFAVAGRADEVQTIIRGNGTQTSNIFEIQDSASNVQVSVSGLGATVFNEEGNDADSRFEGDNDANLLFIDASTDRVGIGDSTPDGRFAVVGRADEVQGIFRGNGTQTSNILEVQTSAAAVVASVSNAGLISGVQLGLTSGVASTTTPNILIRDTAQNFGHAKGSGSTGLYTSLNGMYSARTTDTTVTTKTAPGTLIATITVPADFFRVGRQIRYEFSGRGEAGNLDNLMRLVVQDGSTDLIDTRTSTANSTANVRDIKGEVLITCRSVGGSGSVWVSARVISSLFSEGGGGRDPNTAADTIDTTTSRTFNIRLYWVGTGTNPPTITVSDDFFDIAG